MRENIYIDDNIKFGCEVEFKCPFSISALESKKLDSPFKIELDNAFSTIKEAISPIMTKNDLHHLKDILNLLNFLNSRVTTSEGAHIHFDHSIVSDDKFTNMLKLWCISEDVIFDFSCGEFDRIRPYHMVYAERMKSQLVDMIKNYEAGTYINMEHFKMFRKNYALNLYNHLSANTNKDTYEVRIPNATLNYEIWLNNIDFFANLLSYSNKEESIAQINYYFNKDKNLKQDELRDLIFKEDESKHYFEKQMQKEYVKKNR